MQLFHAIFRNSPHFFTLANKAESLSTTQKIWKEVVPEPLGDSTQAGNIEHKRLTVYVENGAIAAKIKLLLPSLLGKLQKKGLEITSIRVQIQIKSQQEPLEKTPRSISDSASQDIASLAEKLEGTALGDVLKRLATRRKT